MKKIVTVLLTMVLAMSMLAGCGDAVADELEKYINEDMKDVNANYEKLKTEVSTWTGFTDNAQYETSINDKLLPIIDESLDKLSKIELKSDEVKALKEKYKKVLDTYKEGFTSFLTAVQNNDEEGAQTAQTKISEGASLIAEYNTALETLAKEKDMEVKY